MRSWDAEARELTVDFVVHGDEGLAGPWAAAAKPGEEIHFLGPGGAYLPEAGADWHLLAGDESALPAIAASLARMPEGARVHAFIEVAGPEERQELTVPAGAEITWLHRDGAPVGRELVAAVRALDFPAGRVQAFVHGEAGFVKELRRLLRVERGIPREDLSISGYWRSGHDEDGWQASKQDWNQQVEAEQESVPAVAFLTRAANRQHPHEGARHAGVSGPPDAPGAPSSYLRAELSTCASRRIALSTASPRTVPTTTPSTMPSTSTCRPTKSRSAAAICSHASA